MVRATVEQLVLAVKGEIIMSPELDKVSLRDRSVTPRPCALSAQSTSSSMLSGHACDFPCVGVTTPPATGVQPVPGESSPGRVAAARVRESYTSGLVDERPAMACEILRTVARTWKPLRVLPAGLLLSTGTK